MNKFIPVNEPLFDGNEKKYLNDCIDTGWVSSEGPYVDLFEKKFAKKIGRKHAISVANGTAALDIAIEAIGIKKNDEIIVPSFTIISCILQVLRVGAVPVFVDADPITWNMDIKQIESKINDKTKAIMVVHIYGLPVDMEPVLDICKSYNLRLIEDSAEMIGQTYMDKPCGSFGDISTYSFYSNKHVTTGEGGMIFTDEDNLAKKCRELRNLCFLKEKRFFHENLGWNYRMTNLQAAVGVAQLEQLEKFIKKKRHIGLLYNKLLSLLPGVQLPLASTNYSENIYWVYGLVLKDSVPFSAEEIINLLAKNNIGSRPFFFPLHQQPVLKKLGYFKEQSFPVAEKLSNRGFYLPSGLALTDQQIYQVSEKLLKILK
jgi:perosamine synthetase